MSTIKAIALSTLLLSTASTAAEQTVFNCQISETEHVSLGLTNGKLNYYYDDANHPEANAEYPGPDSYGNFSIYNHVDTRDSAMPKDLYIVEIKVDNNYRAVISMSMDPQTQRWATGEVRNYEGPRMISKWQCRFPPMDAYKFQKAFHEKALSSRYIYTDVNPLGSF